MPMNPNRVSIMAQLPKDLVIPFLQHMRDFDTQHDPLHEDKVLLIYFVEGEMSHEEFRIMCASLKPPIEGDIGYIQAVPQ